MTRSLPAPIALLGLALSAVLLAGCTSAFLVDGGTAAPSPTATDATPEPTKSAAPPEPAEEFDCDDVLIDRPGNYVVGVCGTVTLEGGGIDLSFTSIEMLIIRGDGADIVGETLGSVELEGQRADISAISIDDLSIRGEQNTVVVDTTIGTVVVNGNENVVSTGEGIEAPVVDNGLLNEIS
ncbi:hypothetical protein [Pseudolysinimonas yzui]|uniref:DUF3060 domain-containing protein n=1 Tax=Pseudolysinimonas yzui TaxID=2708254 RepID=A0A8J3M2Y9_9MICO|nr:hypothetical protein [Pseudolysinimonas yzui]GHF23311.1 hypothetical protein GCM10011600_25500 [Pseudolysinimonas yzui]